MLRRLILPLLLLLAALAVLAPKSHAARGFEMGIQDDDVLLNHYWGSQDLLYARAKQFHGTWVRTMVEWADTMPASQARAKRKPKHVHYSFTKYNALIAEARRKHEKVQVVLTGPSPAWASANHKVAVTGSYQPSAKEYGKWAGTATRNFRRQKVTRYSIYNEVNHDGYLRPKGRITLAKQGALYRGLYRSGYAAVRKAYPKAQILFGELAPYAKKGQSYSPLAFLRSVLCVNSRYTKRNRHCPKLVADGFAQHPYDNYHKKRGRDDVTTRSLGNLTKALDKLARLGALRKRGGGKLSVYLTEFGYFSRTLNRSTVAVKPESKRARWTIDAYNNALRNSRVKELVWYQLYEPPAGSDRSWLSYFLHLDNTPMQTFTSLVNWSNRNKKKLAR